MRVWIMDIRCTFAEENQHPRASSCDMKSGDGTMPVPASAVELTQKVFLCLEGEHMKRIMAWSVLLFIMAYYMIATKDVFADDRGPKIIIS